MTDTRSKPDNPTATQASNDRPSTRTSTSHAGTWHSTITQPPPPAPLKPLRKRRFRLIGAWWGNRVG